MKMKKIPAKPAKIISINPENVDKEGIVCVRGKKNQEGIEKEFKSILNKRKFIDSWFWERYGINTYNGCQFGCVYCDSRSEKYHLPLDFENNIIVKTNVKEMLDKRLSGARSLLPDVVGLCGTTDPYQPVEAKFKNTRGCLDVLAKHKYPVHIATKSKLVLRDLDLLEEIGKNNWCTISITITTTDSKVARFLEGRAPLPEARFEVIKTIKRKTKHIQAGVLFIPIVPFLCDGDENLEGMVKQAKENHADYILFGGGMTMRDLQAEWFMKHLKKEYPELVPKFKELYRGGYAPKASYLVKIHKKMLALCEKHKIAKRIRRFIPDDYRRLNYILAEKLLSQAYESQMLGEAWSNAFWAGQNIQNLKESIRDIAGRNELQKIRNVNRDMELFVRENLNG